MSNITIQAEDFDLHNFDVVNGSRADGGKLIRIDGNDGSASTTFGGDSATYDITISAQDESDGASRIDIVVDGEVVGTITLDQDDDGRGSNNGGFSEFTLEGIAIPEGADFEIRAWRDGGEFVRIDKVDFESVGAFPAPASGPIVIEAEDLDLSGGFRAVDGSNASDGELIKLGRNDDGRASTDFEGASGTYDITISAQDETDGKSRIEVFVDGQRVGVVILDEQSNGGGSDHGRFTDFTLEGIQIEQGDQVELRAWSKNGEFARIDNLTFTPVEDAPAPAPEFRDSSDLDGVVCLDFDEAMAGDVVGGQFEGVTISAQRDGEGGSNSTSENDAMIFDTANPTGGDNDLASDTAGNVLIISEDNDSSDPDDNADGGTIWFEFDVPSFIADIVVLDAEEGGNIRLLNADGQLIQEIAIPNGVDGDSQQIIIDVDGVSQIDLTLNGSGAVDDLKFVPEAPEPGSLSGRYFMDSDDDSQDNGEMGIEGVLVMLLDAAGNPTGDQVFTDANGDYSFDGLEPGTFGVKFTDPNGVLDGKQLVDSNVGPDATDSDAIGDVVESVIEGIVVNEGQDTPDNDAGAEDIPVVPGSLSGRFFFDEDRNDQDDDEPGIEGVLVMLLDAAGNPTGDQVFTDSNGDYSFGDLAPGTFGVKFTDPNGVLVGLGLVDPNVGPDATDSDAIGDVLESTISGIPVNEGEDTPDNDAGVEELLGSISGRYFCDENGNGMDDAGELGVANREVSLAQAGADGIFGTDDDVIVATATTDENGEYSFDGLAAGDYKVTINGANTLFDGGGNIIGGFVAANQGDDDSVDSDVNEMGMTDVLSLGAGEDLADVDAGTTKFVAPETGSLGIEQRLLTSSDDSTVQFAFAFNSEGEGGTTTYDADTDTLVTTGLVDQVSTTNVDLPDGARTLIQLGVDENGNLVDNGTADFLLFNDLDNDGQVGAGEEVFLEGEVELFRAVDGFGDSSFYDGVVELTGGSMADMFDPLIGVSWSSQFGEGTFADFTQSFSESAKGFFGDAGIDCFCDESSSSSIDDID